jgi:hypothetical protein
MASEVEATVVVRLVDETSEPLARMQEQLQRLKEALKEATKAEPSQDQEERKKSAEQIAESLKKGKESAQGFTESLRRDLVESSRHFGEMTGRTVGLGRAFGEVSEKVTDFGLSLSMLGRGAGLGVGVMVALGTAAVRASEAADRALQRSLTFRRQIGESGEHQINILKEAGKRMGLTPDQVEQTIGRLTEAFEDMRRHGTDSGIWRWFQSYGQKGEQYAEKYYKMLKDGASRIEAYKQLRRDMAKENADFQREFGDQWGLTLREVQDGAKIIDEVEKERDKPEVYEAEKKLEEAQDANTKAVEDFRKAWEQWAPQWLKLQAGFLLGLAEIDKMVTSILTASLLPKKFPSTKEEWFNLLFGSPEERRKQDEYYEKNFPWLFNKKQSSSEGTVVGGAAPVSLRDINRKEAEGNVFMRDMRDTLVWIRNQTDSDARSTAPMPAVYGGPTFHNAPRQGRDRGRHLIPPGVQQPGGGASAESRAYEPTRSTIYYTGPEGSKSVTYTDPATGETYTDTTPPIGPNRAQDKYRIPDYIPGIAFGHRIFPKKGQETLGGYYLVTPREGPNAGKTFILPHSDIGPGGPKGHPEIGAQTLDYNAPAAKMVFGSMKEANVKGGAYVQYIGRELPENVDIGLQKSEDVLARRYKISDAHAAAVNQDIVQATGPGFRGGRDVASELAMVDQPMNDVAQHEKPNLSRPLSREEQIKEMEEFAEIPPTEGQQSEQSMRAAKEAGQLGQWWTAGLKANYQGITEGPDPSRPIQVAAPNLRGYGKRRPAWEKGGSMGWQQRAAEAKEFEAVQAKNMENLPGSLSSQLGLSDVGTKTRQQQGFYYQSDLPPEKDPMADIMEDFWKAHPELKRPTAAMPEADRAAIDRPLTSDATQREEEAPTQINLNFHNAPAGMQAKTIAADDGLNVSTSSSMNLMNLE